MKFRIALGVRKIARTFAVVAYALSLLLAFLAGTLSTTHAAGAAPYVFFPGLGLAVLSPFVWFGARWAMILAFLIGAGLELVMIAISPGEWWLFLALPVVFGMLTLMHALASAGDSQPASQAGIVDKVF